MSGQAGSRGKSGYFSFVDLVDLIGVEKLLGVAQIDLLANEYVEQVRVDMPVQPEVPENLERFGKRLAALVRSVLRGQRLENIRDPHDPCLHRHLLPLQSTRITLPVHALVVTPGVLRYVTQMLRPRQRFQHLDGRNDMVIDLLSLHNEEREKINHHIVATIKMLEALPWPKHLSHVPEYAGGHHERMDGKGYPRGLKREQMSVQARVMGIADIFEALTAKDRPYKRGKTLSESLKILGNFRLNGHIDPDLFDIFVRKKIYLRYAEQFLDPDQIDEVDESKIPGFAA